MSDGLLLNQVTKTFHQAGRSLAGDPILEAREQLIERDHDHVYRSEHRRDAPLARASGDD